MSWFNRVIVCTFADVGQARLSLSHTEFVLRETRLSLPRNVSCSETYQGVLDVVYQQHIYLRSFSLLHLGSRDAQSFGRYTALGAVT